MQHLCVEKTQFTETRNLVKHVAAPALAAGYRTVSC